MKFANNSFPKLTTLVLNGREEMSLNIFLALRSSSMAVSSMRVNTSSFSTSDFPKIVTELEQTSSLTSVFLDIWNENDFRPKGPEHVRLLKNLPVDRVELYSDFFEGPSPSAKEQKYFITAIASLRSKPVIKLDQYFDIVHGKLNLNQLPLIKLLPNIEMSLKCFGEDADKEDVKMFLDDIAGIGIVSRFNLYDAHAHHEDLKVFVKTIFPGSVVKIHPGDCRQ